MPKVSVIIPAYNAGRFLQRAVDSVLAQTFEDWELVIVDDGSDEPIQISPDQRGRITKLTTENRGVSIARNHGILNSSGPYLAFLDADDVWMPRKLSLQVELLDKNQEMAMCHTGFAVIDDDEEPCFYEGIRETNKHYESFETEPALHLLGRGHICASSVMVRRSALSVSGWFDPLSCHSEDYDLFLKLCMWYKLGYLSSCEVYYRKHDRNTSANHRASFANGKEVLRRHQRFGRSIGRNDLYSAAAMLEKRLKFICSAIAFDKCRTNFRKGATARGLVPLVDAALMDTRFVLRSLRAYNRSTLKNMLLRMRNACAR